MSPAVADENRGDDRAGADETPIAKRILIGEPLTSEELEGQLFPKKMALPIFASDALSSVAYAPQELLMILLIGGTAFLAFSPWVAAAVVALLIVVVLSYRQLIKAYPSGGGDYEVARTNLGEKVGVVVAAALLVDYILTVAVSVASGVDNIISALPGLDPGRVELAVGFVVLIILVPAGRARGIHRLRDPHVRLHRLGARHDRGRAHPVGAGRSRPSPTAPSSPCRPKT